MFQKGPLRVARLRELQRDGIISRLIYPEIPPRVEYALTEKGKSLLPIVELMKDWGNENILNVVTDEKVVVQN